MSFNFFVGYDHHDPDEVAAFDGMIRNPEHPLLTQARTLPNPAGGNPIQISPRDPKSEAIKKHIRAQLEKSTHLVVLLGANAADNLWIDWEINTFIAMKQHPSSGVPWSKVWDRVRGVFLPGCTEIPLPERLMGREANLQPYDPQALDQWMDLKDEEVDTSGISLL